MEPKPSVILILEGSGTDEIGIVRDCLGTTPVDRSTCRVVGTWSKISYGTIYVSLTTEVEARQDFLIQHLIKLEAEKKVWLASMASFVPPVHRPYEKPVEVVLPTEVLSELDKLKARLGRR